ncbi:MAG: response regulator, partial [Cytophagales bacterium]|nr:response regulator [Cytophagales bacterium]
PPAGPGEAQTQVLVVEDDPDLRQYIVKHLPGQCVALEAENGAVGWHLAHQQLPDLVITDVMMPGVDGLTLCKRLKKHPHTAHIPVVLLTAKARHEDRIEGLALGANDYLTKPFDARELLLRVQNQLATQKQQREQIQRGFYQHPEKAAAPFSPNNAFLKEVKDVIENNLHVYGFDLEQLSQALHLTPSTLHRKLKALMGVSPGDLIRNYRLERARDLLGRKTGKNVADIALEVGFNDASTFTKAFTKKFGCAPSEYAKKHAK